MPAYLDWNATATVEPAAIEAMTRAARDWGNPSSVHADGRRGKAMLEDARERIAAALGCKASEIVFTSGGTEALALALRGAPVVVGTAVEHSAVLRHLDRAPVAVDADGVVDLDQLDRALAASPPGTVAAVMHANNETGVIQPVAEALAIARRHGARLAVDAVQTAGKLDLPPGDLVAVSAHKLGGPPGVGALVVRDESALSPTGGQERGYRAGTENLPGILGLAAALEARADRGWLARAGAMRDALEARLTGAMVNGAGAPRLPTTSSLGMPGVPAATQVIAFDLAGVRVSAGAACSSGKVAVSHVLSAMGVDGPGEAVRVSLGWSTTQAEVDAFADAWEALARRRAAA